MRILVVDDDFVGRTKIKTLLTKYGEVTAASKGELALKMFEASHKKGLPYHLITMDVDMPDMKGQVVVQKIRRFEKEHGIELADHAKVLMVSGMKDPKNIRSSFAMGCEFYIMKPITPEKIQQALEQAELIEKTPS